VAEFRGAWYKRTRSNDFRNRESGVVVRRVRLRKRRGKTNQAIIFDGTNFKSVETKGRNFYGFDTPPKRPISAKRKFEKRVKVNKNRFSAKKSRRTHTRRVR